jgi:ATP-binding cassette, subfamily B, bacterial PglK
MFDFIQKIFRLLTPSERRHVYWLFGAMVGMGLIEVVGVASIMPFISVVSNPAVIHTNKWLQVIYLTLGFSSPNHFLVFLGTMFLLFLICGNTFSCFTIWQIILFTWMRNHSLGKRLLSRYLSQPYVFFLSRNTSELGKNILAEVGIVIAGIIRPAMEITAKSIVTLLLLLLLCIVDPIIALTMTIILCGSYSLIFLFVQKKLALIGKSRVEALTQAFKNANEAMGGIKELKILGREQFFLDQFSLHSKEMARTKAINQVIAQVPKYVLEAIAFGSIVIVILYLLALRWNTEQVVPLIALYAFAGYRMIPALQMIFAGITEVRFNLSALDVLYQDLQNEPAEQEVVPLPRKAVPPLPFKEELRLRELSFTFPGMTEPVIRNLDLTIRANTTVGFVGATGSGKTTTMDLIMGLLTPQAGQITVDGVALNEANLSQWQRNLGYVSQHIFLSDNRVAANIAFGVPEEEIDFEAVKHAALLAHLHDFVVSLPDGYHTVVGERGVRLSGGQRQRIGIARALYHDPDILVLDEATSSLDGFTEKMVMDAINNLSRKKTIIIVAHRLSTIEDCDVIFLMSQGKVIAQETYRELMRSSSQFRSMARK